VLQPGAGGAIATVLCFGCTVTVWRQTPEATDAGITDAVITDVWRQSSKQKLKTAFPFSSTTPAFEQALPLAPPNLRK
jgi:hypothetical protein